MTTEASEKKRRIAFLGTGLMGAPMARRLLQAGYGVTVWNRDPAKAQTLHANGAVVAAKAADAARDADVVFTMLSDGDAVTSVLFEHGVADELKPGAIVVDTSSIAPPVARHNNELLARRQVHYVDAPVSGGVVGAEAGTLAIMAGGDGEIIAELADLFGVLGRVTHVGPSGVGQICKLANQQIVAITIGAVAEAMMLVEAGGADRGKFRDAIRGGFAESHILELHGKRMVDRAFQPGGPSRLHLKDLDAVAAMSDLFALTLPLTLVIQNEFRDFVAQGGGDIDHSGLLLHLENMNDRQGGRVR